MTGINRGALSGCPRQLVSRFVLFVGLTGLAVMAMVYYVHNTPSIVPIGSSSGKVFLRSSMTASSYHYAFPVNKATTASSYHYAFPINKTVLASSFQYAFPINKTTTASSFQYAISITEPFLPCHFKPEALLQKRRLQAVLDCNRTIPALFMREVLSNVTPEVTTLSDKDSPCLKRFIQSRCYDVNTRVPRVAHYVWHGWQKRPLAFQVFVGVLSAVRFLRPCMVVFHGDLQPGGPYWELLLQLVPIIFHMRSPRPWEISGNKIDVLEHSADVTRLQVLIEYGGVYLDTDQYLLSPTVTELLNYSFTIGEEIAGKYYGNALLFSEPGAKFLKLWLARYSSFNDAVWGHHSVRVPFLLAELFPELVHVVNTFYTPNNFGIEPLFIEGEKKYNWSHLYALHMYNRIFRRFFHTETRIDQHRSVIGDMIRHVIFGSLNSCTDQNNKDNPSLS